MTGQTTTLELFPGFATERMTTSGAEICLRRRGGGPAVLLLHGFPQTHLVWCKVAPTLARRFSVVAPDLRGYGDSSKPAGGSGHTAYSKRAMAQGMVDVMSSLGHGSFAVVGHDRGEYVCAFSNADCIRAGCEDFCAAVTLDSPATSPTTASGKFPARCSLCGARAGTESAAATRLPYGGNGPKR